jgi:hypothetical protein
MGYQSTQYAIDDTWTLDFETYYDDDYSLKKMSMEEYVRHPLFLCHGLSVKRGARPSHWIAGHDRVARFLSSVNFDGKVVIGQNAKFDGFIAHEVFGIKGIVWRDTMAMAAAIYGNTLKSSALWYLAKMFLAKKKELQKDSAALVDTKGKRILTEDELYSLGVYAARDTDSTYELYLLFLRVLEQYPLELGLIELTTTMFTDPRLTLNGMILHDLWEKEVAEKQVMLDKCVAKDFEQVRSNQQFAVLLETLGVEVPMKVSETTDKETYAFAKTDREFTDLQLHENPAVAQLVRSRLRIKSSIEETRALSYYEVSTRGTWPVDLNVSGARTTHRLSGGPGGGGNPQNLGKKSPLRKAIEAPEGYQLVVCDSANIELRVAMLLAGERDVIERMRDPAFDLYRTFAAHIYSKPVADVTNDERTVGKVACLSLQYGSGPLRFRWTAFGWGVELSMEQCERIVGLYRGAFGHITKAWNAWDFALRRLNKREVEQTWMDHIARMSTRTIAGCPGVNLVEGPPITYPNLRQEFDARKGRQQFMYDTWTRGKGAPHQKSAALWGSKVFQHICQSIARSIVLGQVLETDRYMKLEVSPDCQTVLTVHDEGVWVAPRPAVAACPEFGTRIETIFTTPPDWWVDLPLGCDLDLDAPTYGDART